MDAKEALSATGVSLTSIQGFTILIYADGLIFRTAVRVNAGGSLVRVTLSEAIRACENESVVVCDKYPGVDFYINHIMIYKNRLTGKTVVDLVLMPGIMYIGIAKQVNAQEVRLKIES